MGFSKRIFMMEKVTSPHILTTPIKYRYIYKVKSYIYKYIICYLVFFK